MTDVLQYVTGFILGVAFCLAAETAFLQVCFRRATKRYKGQPFEFVIRYTPPTEVEPRSKEEYFTRDATK